MDAKMENCALCGSALKYSALAETMSCSLCGETEEGHIGCPRGHYVCDACHGRQVFNAIRDIALSTGEKDPFKTAELMMAHPALPMLGCEHAFIAAGALMSAIKNIGAMKEGSKPIDGADIGEAFTRTGRQAVGGYCGLTGVCGISPAMGACFSIITGSACGSNLEQRFTMEGVLRVSDAIAGLTGPSCCKAYVRISLAAAADFLREGAGIIVEGVDSSASCAHAERHPHGCRKEMCPYFDASKKSP